MRTTFSSLFVLPSVVVSVLGLAACSVESTSPPSSSSGTGGEKPATSAPSTEPAESPSPQAPPVDANGDEDQSPPPKTPPTPFFEATLDGDPAEFDETSIELRDGAYRLVGVVGATSPYGSDSTLTVRFAKGESGAGVCADGERSVDLWFKDDDGTVRGIGTSYVYGNCAMTLDTSIPGYVSGEAKGTLGGAKQKSFTVKFAQKLP